jgi:hypothetical protein
MPKQGGRAVAVLTLTLLAGCSGSDAAGAARAASDFAVAVSDSDGGRACTLLSPALARSLADAQGTPCASAVLGQQLPPPAPTERTEVDGQQAFVVTRTDTMFLSRFPGGWRVIGAGCVPEGDAPYDCAVSGG